MTDTTTTSTTLEEVCRDIDLSEEVPDSLIWHLLDQATTITRLENKIDRLLNQVLNQAATITEQDTTIARLETMVDQHESTLENITGQA